MERVEKLWKRGQKLREHKEMFIFHYTNMETTHICWPSGPVDFINTYTSDKHKWFWGYCLHYRSRGSSLARATGPHEPGQGQGHRKRERVALKMATLGPASFPLFQTRGR